MISISWIFELIDRLPDLMLYIVQGFLFLGIYNFILNKRGDTGNKDFTVLKSVVLSYILKIVYDTLLGLFFSEYNNKSLSYIAGLLALSCLLSAASAKIIQSAWFNKLLLFVGIHRTTRKNIWEDVIKNGTCMRVFSPDGTSYYGICSKWDVDDGNCIVYLKDCDILNASGAKIESLPSDDDGVLLNIEKFGRIDIIKGEKKKKHCQR